MNYFKNSLDYCLKNRKFTLIILAISIISTFLPRVLLTSSISTIISLLISVLCPPILFASAYSIKNSTKPPNILLLFLKFLPLYVLLYAIQLLSIHGVSISDYSLLLGVFVYILLRILFLILVLVSAIYPPISVTTRRAYRLIFKHPLATVSAFIRYTWFFFLIAWIIATIITWSNVAILNDVLTVIMSPLSTYLYLICAEELTGRFSDQRS